MLSLEERQNPFRRSGKEFEIYMIFSLDDFFVILPATPRGWYASLACSIYALGIQST